MDNTASRNLNSMGLAERLAIQRREWFAKKPLADVRFTEYAAYRLLNDRSEMQRIRAKPWLLIEPLLTVVDKNKKTVPFFLNSVQANFIESFEKHGTDKPYFILKGRQQGFTSLITAMQLCYAITRKNFSGFTVADCTDNVNAIFNDKAKVVYNALPKSLKPHEKYNTKRELFFDRLNSSWRIACAGDAAGRSRTLEFAHFSEAAFYDCPISELQKGVGEALTQNAVVIYETTANGYNEAKELWDSGGCVNLFYTWWKSAEYRLDKPELLDSICDKKLADRLEWLRGQGLDNSQLAWYVNKYNSYLDKSALLQEYPCTPEEAFVASGECEFDKEAILLRLRETKEQQYRQGCFEFKKSVTAPYKTITDIRWVDSAQGEIKLFETPMDEYEEFAIGGDTAGEGCDYFTAVVERLRDCKTVATYRIDRVDEDIYADQIYCLGSMYNNAVIALESNFGTSPIKELVALEYPYIYRHRDGEGLSALGFRTTAITRPLIISALKAGFRDCPQIERSEEVLREMLSFVRINGKPQAASGKHDDMVMAKAIAHYVAQELGVTERIKQTDYLQENFKLSEQIKYADW